MKRFLLLLIPFCVLAGETVVETPGPSTLYRKDGTSQVLKTYAECRAAAPISAAGEGSRCSTVTNLVKTGTCDAAEPPELPETEGIPVQCPNDANRWYLRVDGWKREGYPSCAWKLAKLPETPPEFCSKPIVNAWTRDDPDSIAETPPIDPDFDEFSEEGPGPGPPGAKPVDKVARN